MTRPVRGFDATTIEIDGAACDVIVRWTYYPEEAPSRTSDGANACAEIDEIEPMAGGAPIEITDEQRMRRDPRWIAPLVTWLASEQAADVTGRVFEAWGYGYSVAENWQHGAIMDAVDDPNLVGDRLRAIIAASKPNAGIERDTWMNP